MSAPPTTLDRSLASFRALVRSVFPALRYFGRYRYSVHSATATTFDGLPVDASVAPQLPTGVPYSPPIPGSSYIPTTGTIAHVMFADGDPSQPVCVGFEEGGSSTVTAIDAGSIILGNATPVATSPATAAAERRAICYGDIVSVGTSAGPIALVGPTCSKVRA